MNDNDLIRRGDVRRALQGEGPAQGGVSRMLAELIAGIPAVIPGRPLLRCEQCRLFFRFRDGKYKGRCWRTKQWLRKTDRGCPYGERKGEAK